MKRFVTSLILVLALSPGLATAGTLCIQNDSNGSVTVIKGIGKGSKPVSVYYAVFLGGSTYSFRVTDGSAILSGDNLGVGLTEYGIGPGAFVEQTTFHRIRCDAGSDHKLGENDSCQDITWSIPSNSQNTFSGHVVPCIPQLKIP